MRAFFRVDGIEGVRGTEYYEMEEQGLLAKFLENEFDQSSYPFVQFGNDVPIIKLDKARSICYPNKHVLAVAAMLKDKSYLHR